MAKESDVTFAVLAAKVEGMQKKLDGIKRELFGNGQPGMKWDVEQLKAENRARQFKDKLILAIVVIVCTVATNLATAHFSHQTENLPTHTQRVQP